MTRQARDEKAKITLHVSKVCLGVIWVTFSSWKKKMGHLPETGTNKKITHTHSSCELLQ